MNLGKLVSKAITLAIFALCTTPAHVQTLELKKAARDSFQRGMLATQRQEWKLATRMRHRSGSTWGCSDRMIVNLITGARQ